MRLKGSDLKRNALWVWHFLTVDIWKMSGAELGRWGQALKAVIEAGRSYSKDRIMLKASALTYYTLLAIVPILALVVAIGKGFGFEESIDGWIVDVFEGHEELVPYVLEFVGNYLNHAHGGVFVGIGIALLLWSVMGMFRNIESNVNVLWNVKENRSILRQFMLYLSLMLLLPVLIVSATGLSSVVDGYLEVHALGRFKRFLLQLSPFVVYWLLFSLVYIIIPNTKVKVWPAVASGVLMGTAFQLFQFLYVTGQINLTKYNAVYGSFAFLPLLLFWLQVSWAIVLFGAKICYVLQNLDSYDFRSESTRTSRDMKDYVELLLLRDVVRGFECGDRALDAGSLAERHGMPFWLATDGLERLCDMGLLVRVKLDGDDVCGYQPGLDTHVISVGLMLERTDALGSGVEDFGKMSLRLEKEGDLWGRLMAIKGLSGEERKGVMVRDL